VQPAGVGRIAGQERAHDVGEMAGAAHRDAFDERRFIRTRRRQDQRSGRLPGHASQGQRHRQRAVHGPQLAGQRELARELESFELGRVELAGGGEDAEGDRQVEASRFLREVGRREAHGHALVVRELEAAGLQSRTHALARFLDFRVRESDEGEARQAVGEMHFDSHGRRGESAQGAAVDEGKGHGAG
jgi:hypothetical protein